MGLFDKKYCDVCGEKIKLLGNRKLEDGNLCKDCAAKLSPWFSERRHSTLSEIKNQLAYREQNKQAVAAFHTTRSLGKYTKVLLDEDARKFMVTSASDLNKANPDVLDYADVTGCDVDVNESRSELKQTVDGKSVSYNPPRYEYSYNFYVTVRVNNPYFDDMRFPLNSGSVKTGERSMAGARTVSPGVNIRGGMGVTEYYEYMNLGNEIRDTLLNARQETRDRVVAENTPKTAVTCPCCGATTIPDANGCCEYCGGVVNG